MYRHLPSLNLLRSFEAAGRLLSFKAASEELCVTPSAVSHQIRELEEHLGVALFLRFNRSLQLTEAGRRYLVEIQGALQKMSEATDALRPSSSDLLRVSAIPFVASDIIAPRLPEFQANHPGLKIQLMGETRLRNLQDEQIDVAIRFSRDAKAQAAFSLGEGQCTPLCTPDLVELLRREPDALRQQTCFQLTGDEDYWRLWLQSHGEMVADSNHPVALGDSLMFNNYHAVLAAVARGKGICLGYLPLVSDWLERGELDLPFPQRLLPLGSLYVLVRPAVAERRDVRLFLEWLRALVEDYSQRNDRILNAARSRAGIARFE